MQRKITLSLLLFFIAFQAIEAQNWCPPGATWYFAEYYPHFSSDTAAPTFLAGYDRASYVKDTVINNQACKVITDTAYYENFTQVQPNWSIYTFESGDTVYLFNNNRFLPYFYFGCHTGDTLLVPYGDTAVATYVDSSGITVLNGDSLRFYNYRAIDSVYGCIGLTGGPSGGEVVERIGNITVDPGDNSFSFDFSCMEWETGYFLHCYRDDSLALYIKDSTESCTYIETGIKNIAAPVEFTLSPNPVSGYCGLQLAGTGQAYTAGVYDMAGKLILPLFNNQHISGFDFNTMVLSAGLYFVRVNDESGAISTGKLVKMK